MTKPKLFLLTGAGFSIEFLKYNCYKLDTKFLTDLLIEKDLFIEFLSKLSSDSNHHENDKQRLLNIRDLCETVYQDLQDIQEKINFEHIIYALEKICELTPENTIDVTSNNIENKIISHITKGTEYKITRIEIHALKSFILDVVALFSSNLNGIESRTNPIITKFKSKLNKKYHTSHFTLNYDNLFAEIPHSISENSFAIREVKFDSIISYYLHGSVFFYRAGDSMGVSNKNEASYYRKNILNTISYFNAVMNSTDKNYFAPVIVGLEKASKLQNVGYDGMWHQCIRDFYNADELLIIGYSFNDRHINDLLRYTFTDTKISKVVVVDSKSTKNEEEKFIYDVESIIGKGYSDNLQFHLEGCLNYLNKFLED